MPVAYTYTLSVQVSDFEDMCLLIQRACLMRFLCVRPALCLRLPSDSMSPWTPLPSGYHFPLSGVFGIWEQSSPHPKAGAPCRAHTKKARVGNPGSSYHHDVSADYILSINSRTSPQSPSSILRLVISSLPICIFRSPDPGPWEDNQG